MYFSLFRYFRQKFTNIFVIRHVYYVATLNMDVRCHKMEGNDTDKINLIT
jgi:hypothetical protein